MPEPRRRIPPRGLQRLLTGYLVAVLALACGLPVLILGWVLASRCTSPGFTCLGWLIYGAIAAAAIAVLTVLPWSRRLAMGAWFALLTLALVAAPLVLGDGSALSATAFLGPGLAAWITEPIEPHPDTVDPLGPAPVPRSPLAHWGPRIGAALVVSLLIPLLGRAF